MKAKEMAAFLLEYPEHELCEIGFNFHELIKIEDLDNLVVINEGDEVRYQGDCFEYDSGKLLSEDLRTAKENMIIIN